jgi:hypothetical protein
MRMRYLIAYSVFVAACIILAKTAKADLLVPPVELLITPLSLGLFLGNLIINFVVFGMGYLFVVERDIKKINKKPFLVSVFLITLAGFFSDSIAFLFYGRGVEMILPVYLSISGLIILLDFLICRFYLKMSSKKSIILGVWMGIATNPFIYLILSFFFSLPLTIFYTQPSHLNWDLGLQAHAKLQETFQMTQSNFAVWPDSFNLYRGGELKMSAGVKNNANDGQDHEFTINIVPANASINSCASGDINSCNVPGGKSLKDFMQDWVSWDNQPGIVQINKTDLKAISVIVPQSAALGNYTFNIIACLDVSSYNECTLQTSNWGNPQRLTITVK